MAADFLYEPPHAERTVSVRLGAPPNSLKLSTISHVVAGGLPVSATHLKRVKDGLVAGLYESDREALIREVKYDPGLFAYCVRQAPDIAGNTGRPVDLFSELRNWPQDQLLRLLHVDRHAVTRHMLVHSNILQASILQHLLLCIAAVEVIAPKLRIDPEAAYTVSMFREIGDALVAWNYYEIYSRVLSNHRRFGSDIEAEWIRLLGVTPHRIGIALADDWKLPSSVRFAFQQHGKQADSVAAITGGGEPALHALAILVDKIAQLHDPVHYPDGPQLWAGIEAEVTKLLGGGLMKEIVAHARLIFALYEQEVPSLSKLVFAQSVYRKAPDPRVIPRAALAKTNAYVPRCPETVHARFQQVYGCLTIASQLTGAIRIFEEQLVAECGFTRGCLYLLDAAKGMLYPTLSFGDRSLDAYPSHSAVEDNEFSAFLRNAIPYRSVVADATGLDVDRIIGGLNSTAHPGVLYLELGPQLTDDPSSDPLLMFHALRATINDILSTK